MDCSCLIPAYNEATRIEDVLKKLAQVPLVKDIIVVDDGSTDKTRQVVRNKFPQLQLVSLPENQGKAAAVKVGLSYVKTSHVLLFDADLKNIKVNEINAAIELMLNKQDLDMVILKKVYDVDHMLKHLPPYIAKRKWVKNSIFVRLSYKTACTLSGDRVIKTKLLRKVFEAKIKNYGLEVAINQYLQKNNYQTCWMPSSALNDLRTEELGALEMTKKFTSMSLDIIRYMGIKQYIHQVKTFCNNRCEIN